MGRRKGIFRESRNEEREDGGMMDELSGGGCMVGKSSLDYGKDVEISTPLQAIDRA